MPMVLPGPPPPPDEQVMDGLKWELAAPTNPSGPQVPRGNEVTMNRTGPGDVNVEVDQWSNVDIFPWPHGGIQNGRENFVNIPGPPPEGHGGYDFDGQSTIDRSSSRQALFWSDWYASTAANAGGGGSFRGEHVTIARIPPGSIQGYQPTDPGMVQANNDRALPSPWDAGIVLGAQGG